MGNPLDEQKKEGKGSKDCRVCRKQRHLVKQILSDKIDEDTLEQIARVLRRQPRKTYQKSKL